MANNATKIANLVACSTPAATDLLALVSNVAGNAWTQSVTANVLFHNTAANVSMNVATFATITITGNSTPSTNTDNASRANGSIWSDGAYIYHWNGTRVTRATLATF